MALKAPKPKPKKFIYNINFISAVEKSNVNIDLIALSENDLMKIFNKLYRNAEFKKINTCTLMK